MSSLKAQKTRSALLAAARDVILELGIDRLSMDRVAQTAGMSKGAVMYHFKTRRALLAPLVEEYAEHLESRLKASEALFEGTPDETFFSGYVEWYRSFDRDNAHWAHIGTTLLNQNFQDPELLEPVRRWYEKTFSRLRALPKEKQPMALLCIMALEGLFYTHKFGLDPLRDEEKNEIYASIRRAFPAKAALQTLPKTASLETEDDHAAS